MADARFFRTAGPFRLGELAARSGAELSDPAQADRQISDVAPLDRAEQTHVSWLDNAKYLPALSESRAGAIVLRRSHASRAPAGAALLISAEPYRSYALIAQAFYPPAPVHDGVAPGAVVAESAVVRRPCEIGANAVIGPRAEIGPDCRIGASASIGEGVVVGEGCSIGANVSVSHCLIGDRVTLHAGVRVGQDGFGFAPDPSGHVKVPQVGRVLIGDDCEIGANTTIDRGSVGDTVIGPGCWLDNLVQIGHNVHLGRGCIIVSQVGISGSTHIGDFVAIGGQAGLAGHLKIGDGAQIAARSGVIHDLQGGGRYGGAPAIEARAWMRQLAAIKALGERKGRADE